MRATIPIAEAKAELRKLNAVLKMDGVVVKVRGKRVVDEVSLRRELVRLIQQSAAAPVKRLEAPVLPVFAS